MPIRAYYYLGYLCVKTRRFRQALEYLERGQELEPTNPNFNFEMAQALVYCGERERAFALYAAVSDIGPYVSVLELALARRGCGCVLIELGRLEEAEEAFKASLEIEPDNPGALNELKYIDHLRKGGSSAPPETVPTQAPNLSRCAACGSTFAKGTIVKLRGIPNAICAKCERKHSKQWWQFWK